MTAPIQIDIIPSYRLTWLAVVFHLGALVAVLAGLPAGLAVYLSGAVLISLLGALTFVRLKRSDSLVSLTIAEDGKVQWISREGKDGIATVARGSYVSPSFVVLRLVPANASLTRERTVLLAADSVTSESLAKLRTWLKWGPTEHVLHTHAKE